MQTVKIFVISLINQIFQVLIIVYHSYHLLWTTSEPINAERIFRNC